ncbi:MAG: DinB family protein [Dehalococcoidia bacterium]
MVAAIDGLTPEQLHFRPAASSNSVGWEAWHLFRSADNLVHFVFHRERPIWLTQGLDEAWHLPRVEQGTGMAPEVAHALVFPDAALLAGYGRDVRREVVLRIEAMTDDELQVVGLVRPWGEITRLEAIGQVVIAHGNGHLGQVSSARALLGLTGSDI